MDLNKDQPPANQDLNFLIKSRSDPNAGSTSMHFYLKYCITFPYKTIQKEGLQKFWNIPLFLICLLKNNEVLSIKTRIFTVFFIMMVSVIAHFNITEYIFIIMKNLGNLQKKRKCVSNPFVPEAESKPGSYLVTQK